MNEYLGNVATDMICNHRAKESFILAKDARQCDKASFELSADCYRRMMIDHANKIISLRTMQYEIQQLEIRNLYAH